MTLRVLHVIDHLGYGGAPMVIRNLVEPLRKHHVKMLVCALRPNPRPVSMAVDVMTLNYGRYNPMAVSALGSLCRTQSIDIIHAHLQKSIVCSLLAGKRCSAPVIIHEHGAIFRGGTGCLYRMFLRKLGKRAARVIANSAATKQALARRTGFPEPKIEIVPNFVDMGCYDPRHYDRTARRRSLGATADSIVLGFVGRLDTCKGADRLLKAAGILCAGDTRFRVVIVGDGPQYSPLAQQARRLKLEDRVIFTGLCDNPAEIMVACDLAIVPSRREAFGLAALEFMRMGVPVISSAVGGLPELIRHESTGLLIHKTEPQQLVQAIQRLVSDHTLYKSVRLKAQELAQQFDGAEQVEKLARLYRSLT